MKKERWHRASGTGNMLREVILGGQDGLVNVLGIILAVATASQDVKFVIIAGLAATFAESISMAAVAYTSTKAEKDFYKSEEAREIWEMKHWPERERKEIRDIYKAKGFSGRLLEQIVKKITSNKRLWLKTMMEEELKLFQEDYKHPGKSAVIVGLAAIVGSLIPLVPFFFMGIETAIIGSIIFSVIILFVSGMVKGKLTTGTLLRSGIEMAVIGIGAALIGYGIGAILGVAI